jgi:hypothetical protein
VFCGNMERSPSAGILSPSVHAGAKKRRPGRFLAVLAGPVEESAPALLWGQSCARSLRVQPKDPGQALVLPTSNGLQQ